VKTDWKILPVLAPGGLLGAGAGTLLGAFQTPVAGMLQMTGIALMVGGMALRIALSEWGLSLSSYGGLAVNSLCLFLSGLATISLLSWMFQAGADVPLVNVFAVVAFAWLPCAVLSAVVAVVVAKIRKRVTVDKQE
jgi:hypothetical protein